MKLIALLAFILVLVGWLLWRAYNRFLYYVDSGMDALIAQRAGDVSDDQDGEPPEETTETPPFGSL